LLPNAPFLFHSCKYYLGRISRRASNHIERRVDPVASRFYDQLLDGGYAPNSHIDALPCRNLLYIAVPKSASSTIKMALVALTRRNLPPPDRIHKRRLSPLKSPEAVGISAFHRFVTNPATLRFSFVRNPYARLVSAWADKFQDKPLIAGNSFVEQYLAHRSSVASSLPSGRDQTLSFAQFVEFATATAGRRLDAHWQLQDDLIEMPGIALDFVGKVESFPNDFVRILDHAGAGPHLRHAIGLHLNVSRHLPWQDYYTAELAGRVYRAYERDFSRFGYLRTLS